MLEGLCRLIGVPAAAGGEERWIRPHRAGEPISAFDAGFDSRGHELYMAYMRELGPAGDPIYRALQPLPGRHVIRTRRQLLSDPTWYGRSPGTSIAGQSTSTINSHPFTRPRMTAPSA
jgi:hypothetical protein